MGKKLKVEADEQITVVSYKGFDNDLSCRGFEFEVGKAYTHDGEVENGASGFHACEYPLDVLSYYPAATSRYAVVEQTGKLSRHSDDTRIASAEITIRAEIKLPDLIAAAVKYVFDRAKWTDGPVATGDNEAATASGVQGAATASGYQGAATASGYASCAMATGIDGKVRGEIDGVDLFARELEWTGAKYASKSIACGTTGKSGIKSGVWYRCVGGKLVGVD